MIETIKDMVCNRLHNEISLDEIKDTILHMYILIGDVIKAYENYVSKVYQKRARTCLPN